MCIIYACVPKVYVGVATDACADDGTVTEIHTVRTVCVYIHACIST